MNGYADFFKQGSPDRGGGMGQDSGCKFEHTESEGPNSG